MNITHTTRVMVDGIFGIFPPFPDALLSTTIRIEKTR